MLSHLQKLVFLCLLTNAAFSQTNYEIIDLGTLGGTFSSAYGINDSSQVVGRSSTANFEGRAFLWDNGIMTSLGTLGGNSSDARDINNLTQIVGVSLLSNGHTHGFLWDSGVMIDLGTLGGNTSAATSINDSMQIVGSAKLPSEESRAFIWQNGNMTNLGTFGGYSGARGINKLTQVTGYSSNGVVGDEAFLWENDQMTGLGTLGGSKSYALGINNKTQIVGNSNLPNFFSHAFLWENDSMQNLGTLTGVGSFALAINDSSEIVGSYQSSSNVLRACIWYDGLAYDLNTLIPTNSGWILTEAKDINNKGEIVGEGYYNSQTRAFLLRPRTFAITSPLAGEKWIAGETDTIRWTGGQQGQLLDLEYTTDNGNSFSIIQLGVLAESLSYEWTIPSNLLSTKIKIRLRDVIDTLISVTSDSFRVKPYIITKVNANGDYIAYDRVTDVWNFGNYPEDMWPMDWYNQFDYHGIDPFTESQYSQWQADFTFASSLNWEHMDWISWVNAFGIDACYYNLTLGIYNPSAVLWWEAIKSNWNGSCFGIAGTNALAFISKDTFREAYPSFPSFFSPITVLADTGVRRVVNELFVHQFGNPSRQAKLNNNRWKTITPNETLNEVKAMLREDSVKIRTLLLFNNNGVGGHNILVYGLEQDETQKELYYLLVYDNSYPTIDNALVLIDTTGNSNQGTWLTTYHWTTWGGPTKLFLDIESSNYLTGAILPNEKEITQAPFILSGNQIDIHSNIDANIQIVDMQGNITGFINDVLYDEIPAASPLIYLNGSETPPYGYSLPADNYSVVLNEFAEDTVETFFFTGNKSFVYERSGATQTQTDRLFFDGGVSAVNPDAQTKTVKILNLINETTQEKLFVARSLELSQNDSVKIENPDSNKVKLISYGTAKEYDLELNYVTENGIGRFGDFSIPLSANSSHTFVPVWTDLTNTELQVLVDFGNDGTIDDTLSLINQITGIGDDQGLLNTPNSFNLAQNYPNPFNPTTKISWQSPVGSHQTLKIYDVLGNEVATLVDEYREAGRYAVEFDASQLSSGIYLYRLQAGSFVQTRKMILLR